MRQRMLRPQCRFDPLLLVNAAHPLPKEPWPDLTAVDECFPDVLLERRVAGLLGACIQAVNGQGQIVPVSGWRSQAEQLGRLPHQVRGSLYEKVCSAAGMQRAPDGARHRPGTRRR